MKQSTLTFVILGTLMALVVARPAMAALENSCQVQFWANEQNLDQWQRFGPDDLFVSAGFADAFPGMTLRNVLVQDQPGEKSDLDILGQQAVIALLIAGSPDHLYPYDAQQIVSLFNRYYDFLAKDLGTAFAEMNDIDCNFYLSSVK